MSTTSVELSCPDGTNFYAYDSVSGVYVTSGTFSVASYNTGYCGTGAGGVGATGPMVGRFNAVSVQPFDISASDGVLIATAILGVWALAWTGKALYRTVFLMGGND